MQNLRPLVFFMFIAPVNADVLTLKSGKSINGFILSLDTSEVRINRCGHVDVYPRTDVASIRTIESAADDCSIAPQSRNLELPSGIKIRARLLDFVDSAREPPGQSFRATVIDPVVSDGRSVIRKGAGLLIKLIPTADGGQTLDLTGVNLDVNEWANFHAQPPGIVRWVVGEVTDERKKAANEDPAPIVLRAKRVYVPSRTTVTFTLKTAVWLALRSPMQ